MRRLNAHDNAVLEFITTAIPPPGPATSLQQQWKGMTGAWRYIVSSRDNGCVRNPVVLTTTSDRCRQSHHHYCVYAATFQSMRFAHTSAQHKGSASPSDEKEKKGCTSDHTSEQQQQQEGGASTAEVKALLLRLRKDKKFANRFSGLLTPEDLQDLAMRNQEERKLEVTPLTPRQWRQHFVRTSVPFFGFGVCDNLIMISVGDAIDSHFGVTLGFSTMIAAGLGQAVSDGSGITIQGFIEASADRLGLPDPHLTEAQRYSKPIVFWTQVFRTIGIVLGCLFGLIPLFFFDTGNRPRLYDQMLKVLPEDQRRALSAKSTMCTFKEGEYLLEFDREPAGMFTIVSGEVKVVGRNDYGDEVEFCTNGPGYGVGVVELVFQHHCVADVVAMSPTVKALKVSKSAFEQCSASNNEMKALVTEYVSKEDNFVPYRMRYLQTDENGQFKFVNDGTLHHFGSISENKNNAEFSADQEVDTLIPREPSPME